MDNSLPVPKPYLGLCLDLPGRGRRPGAVSGGPIIDQDAGISWKAAPLPHAGGQRARVLIPGRCLA